MVVRVITCAIEDIDQFPRQLFTWQVRRRDITDQGIYLGRWLCAFLCEPLFNLPGLCLRNDLLNAFGVRILFGQFHDQSSHGDAA